VKRQQVSEYIWSGTAVRFLTDVREGALAHGSDRVIGNAEGLRFLLEKVGLFQACRAYDWHVQPTIQGLKKAGPDYLLTSADVGALETGIQQLRTVLDVESAGIEVFVTEERRYATAKLMGDVGALLPSGMFAALPPIAQSDLSDAGQALVYGLGTAAAFHAIRATEELLRMTYRTWTPPRSQVKKPWLWKAMLDHLRLEKNGPPVVVLDNLDYLRRTFRNPTDHPELTYDMDEAQELFAACLQSIAVMKRACDQRSVDRARRAGARKKQTRT
jgi:hypothetical protein